MASYFIYVVAKAFVEIEETDLYSSYLNTSNANLENILSDVYAGTNNHLSEIEASLGQPERMSDIMKEVVARNHYIRSCGISFIDNYYPQKGRWFCPYAVKHEDGHIESRIVGDASHDYLKAEWFTEAVKAEKGYWSKPFFDSYDSITPLVSYLLPVRDKQGKTVAVVGADLMLNLFTGNTLTGMKEGEHNEIHLDVGSEVHSNSNEGISLLERKWRIIGRNFIIDKDGTFIAHTDSSRVIKDNYFELAKATPDTIDDHIGRMMVAGKRGYSGLETGGFPRPVKFFDVNYSSAYLFYEPVKNTTWSIALAVPSYMIIMISISAAVFLLVLIGLALLVVRIVGRIIINRVTLPIGQLAESANEVAGGNFNAPLPQIKHNDEIRLLRDSFEGMQHSLKEYIAELKKTTASKAAIEKELKVAHDIQMSMLPKTFPPYPERNDIDIYGLLTPAKDVGGDLFDFFIRDEKLFFCIGDVSGKGVPASLLMATTRSLFRNVCQHVSEPDVVVRALNDAVAEGNEANMFVTLFLGVLDLQTGILQYCNAGHNSPLLLDEKVRIMECDSNVPVGIIAGWSFSRQEIQLNTTTIIFLYTDGLNEAEDSMQAQFGEQRIISVAESQVARGTDEPAVIVNEMEKAVHRFVDEAEQSDDLTMLAIKYIPK